MKKSILFAVLSIAAVAFTSCQKDEDLLFNDGAMMTRSVDEPISNVIIDDVWTWSQGDLQFKTNVPSGVAVYANDTTYVIEAALTSRSFEKIGEESVGNWERGELISATGDVEIKSVLVRKHTQAYKHTLDKVEGELVQNWTEGRIELENGRVFTTPERNASLAFNAEPAIVALESDDAAEYFNAKMNYAVSIDGQNSSVEGNKTLAIETIAPEDVFMGYGDVDEEGFEELSYDENGNLKTGRSWKKLAPLYSESGMHEPVMFEVILNYSVKGLARTVEYGANFNGIAEIGEGAMNEVEGSSRKDGDFSIITLNREYKSGLVFDGKNLNKVFTMSREKATLVLGSQTFDMPSPAFENLSNTFSTSNLNAEGGYERKLNTITLKGSINGKDIKNVLAETELKVKEEAETFTKAIIASGIDYVNPSTSNSWITIRETGSKGTVKEYNRDINLFNGILSPEDIEKIVKKFDSKSTDMKIGSAKKVSTRNSGEFTIDKFEVEVTVGSENVERTFVLYYEKPVWNPMSYDMEYAKYENITDNGFNSQNLSDENSNDATYSRKLYVYSIAATFLGHGAEAEGKATLKVEKQKEEERTTPAWLGKAVGANYTRVQKAEGDKFEDMISFIYENGVVLAPNGKADLKLVFAYDQSVADNHGVEKCVKGSAYTAVWKNGAWIPAKGETLNGGKSNETWVYTGKGASHSVMANNATTLGIGADRTWNPGEKVSVDNGTITVKYSKNNSSLSYTDVASLK
jgi:hypothetical protein